MRTQFIKLMLVAVAVVALLVNGIVVALAFDFLHFMQLGPSTLEQTSPASVTYVEDTDYALMGHSEPGDVTAAVTAVDLDLALGNHSDSGCEATDFSSFPAGNIALVQRGTCFFLTKAENAAAAGAVGVIVLNQGDTEERKGLFFGTLTSEYTGGIPVFSATYDRGVEWSGTPGLAVHMIADVFRGLISTTDMITMFDDFVDDGTLEGNGTGGSADARLSVVRNTLVQIGTLSDAGNTEGACGLLEAADRQVRIREFVIGDSTTDLILMIASLRSSLGCF